MENSIQDTLMSQLSASLNSFCWTFDVWFKGTLNCHMTYINKKFKLLHIRFPKLASYVSDF